VKAAGGLCVIGTERHESRRIDNQLRGRAGRQGDPGSSQFYLSLEDDLMRLFGGSKMESVARMMEKTEVPDDMPIQAGMVSKSIESAQRQVEGMHFGIRKNVLEYDDVMNLQRKAIYEERNAILDGKNMLERLPKVIEDAVEAVVAESCQGAPDDWNKRAVEIWMADMTGEEFRVDAVDYDGEPEELAEEMVEAIEEMLEEKAERLGPEAMRQLAAQVMLRVIDTRWMAHLQDMDYLKAGIGLRAVGQRDPLVEYKNEAYIAFERLTARMYDDYLRTLLRLQLAERKDVPAESADDPHERKMSYSSPEAALESTGVGAARRAAAVPAAAQSAPPKEAPAKPQTYQKDKDDPFANVGRNDMCPCGSGKKYKKCCGK
ncbi:MAG: SEC-C domain-containing protein, partial [Eggerthellaceae bacterium]|nr:SEC-C domain-containing protein [Eggerthellaceae bacterium]